MKSAIIMLVFLFAGSLCMSACRNAEAVEITDAVKFTVYEDGIYRLGREELEAVGLGFEAFTVEQLNLTKAGESMPFVIREDDLIFYGQAPSSRYTNVQTYVLRAGEGGESIESVQMPNDAGPTNSVIPVMLQLEENYLYASEIPSLEPAGPWFWTAVRDYSEFSFDVPAVADGSGDLQINLYGTTHNPKVEMDHSLMLTVNDREVDQIVWEGQTYYTSTVSLPAGTLQTGDNTISLQNIPEAYLDFSNLNWIRILYAAPPTAHDDIIAFDGIAGTVELEGFSRQPTILDISEPGQPIEITGWAFQDEVVSLGVTEDMDIIAAGPKGYKQPEALEPLRDAGLRDEQQRADLLIITTGELASGMAPLVSAREEEGLAVALVTVDEIYDAFGFGQAGPESIRDFIRYTQEAWTEPAPKYVLLVGEATTDFRGYLASRPVDPVQPPTNIVPTYMVPASFSGETVSDARIVDLDGDLSPDLAVGRWPVDSLDEVDQLVRRTLEYEQGAAQDRALFAADGTSPEFSGMVNRLLAASEFPSEEAELLNGAPADEVAANWNSGAWLVTYTGHGSLELWGKEEVFSVDAVSQLGSAGTPPIVLQLTCLSGLFAHPETTSLSETLLGHKNGPVLLIGATSLTYSFDQEPFALELLTALQDERFERIGDVFQHAKAGLDVEGKAGTREVSDTFTLFGDPSARVMRPPRP